MMTSDIDTASAAWLDIHDVAIRFGDPMITECGTVVLPGPWLRRQREMAGLTREAVAQRSSLSVRTISDLELGRTRRPYPRSLYSLADALSLPEAVADELIAWYRADRLGTAAAPFSGRDGSGEPAGDIPAVLQRQALAVVPRQLPAALAHFAGRPDELEFLDGLADLPTAKAGSTVVVAAVGGTAGVGKSALAVYWAHQAAVRFPDGQLYVNLCGHDPSRQPVRPDVAIRGFLDAFQVPREQIPASLDAQTALYRSLLATRRVLVVLDNARDAGQVRPLLPGSPGCMVVVTSRSQLTSLIVAEGAYPLTLGVLTDDEARGLLARRVGPERLEAEPQAAGELIALCARLPLALAITAGRAATRPGFPLAALVAELRDARARLDALDAGDATTSVRAMISLSYGSLTDEAARMFRLLGLHPGHDITIPTAASLAGLRQSETRRPLRELTDAHLLTEYSPGRFTHHDLLRLYAVEQADACDGQRRESGSPSSGC